MIGWEKFTLHKVLKDDETLPTAKHTGLGSANDFDEILVAVSLHNSCTGADVEPYWWSPAAGASGVYLPEVGAPQAFSVSGAGMVKRLRIYRSKYLYLFVDNIAGGVDTDDRVKIEVKGIPSYQTVG